MSKHPHFDENLIVWSDDYHGRYGPPPTGYAQQFDLQWKLAVEGDAEYYEHPGASVDDHYIEDRVFEWTGIHPKGSEHRPRGVRPLDIPLRAEYIRGKKCIDIGCGMGRWTRTMQALGAESVLSIDASENALRSVRRFNPNSQFANIMRIPEEHPEWVGKFDFACFWGVAMCTNDPLQAWLSAASTVAAGGRLYLMVYNPEGIHNTPLTNLQRKRFHGMTSLQNRLEYVRHVAEFEWDSEYSLKDNLRNQVIRVARHFVPGVGAGKMGYLDLLEPYYNWVIPRDVIAGWAVKGGFAGHQHIMTRVRSAYHVLFWK